MDNDYLILPPIAFLVVMATIYLLSLLFSKIAFKHKGKPGGTYKAYACGEDLPKGYMIQPDYSQFFPFAFFFTILHVVALVIATVPIQNLESFTISIVYVLGAIVGLLVLLRR